MPVTIAKDKSANPAKTVAAPEPAAAVELSLIAHNRFHYRGTLFERKDTYLLSAEAAASMLALRTDDGKMVFARTADLKAKPIPEELQAPKSVDLSKQPKLVAGMNEKTAKAAFNLTTAEEDAEMEAAIAARAAQEEATQPTDDGEQVEV